MIASCGQPGRRALGLGAGVALAALLLLGCGQQFDLPAQPDKPLPIPEPGTYNLKTTWTLPAPGDLASFGLYLFVITAQQRLEVYYTTRYSPQRPPMVSEFTGLLAPVQVAVTKRDSLFVVVADSGDMRCKVYYWLGGPPLQSFTDSAWVELSGLAADGDLTIYLADAARDTVMAYDRWGHRKRVITDYGTGSGYVIDPHGLAHNGELLVVADTGKNWVQRLEPDTTNIPAILEPIGRETGLLDGPLDVAVDRQGEFIYVADTGHHRVLRFLTTGAFSDTVYSPQKIDLDPPLASPRWVCSEDSLVFISDPARDRLVLLELKAL